MQMWTWTPRVKVKKMSNLRHTLRHALLLTHTQVILPITPVELETLPLAGRAKLFMLRHV